MGTNLIDMDLTIDFQRLMRLVKKKRIRVNCISKNKNAECTDEKWVKRGRIERVESQNYREDETSTGDKPGNINN